ncbi:MAG TPA: hypothetical protein VHM92_09575 [Allosphingosinicella sp.]|nr:hypothetical protein [Allosphingosinicella sp.]
MRISPPPRKRTSVLPKLLLLILVLLVAFLVWMSMRDTTVPTQRIEQDVTNEALKP